MATALVNGKVLTDDGLRGDLAVLVDGARIVAVVNDDDALVRDAAIHDLRGASPRRIAASVPPDSCRP